VIEANAEGHRRLRFAGTPNVLERLNTLGEVPLPPYIARPNGSRLESDRERYQTVFARPGGSVAAPTAGLHFTEALLAQIAARGTQVCFLTLHVGLGTFRPVKTEQVEEHVMHSEHYEVPPGTAEAINSARAAGGRVVAVGTTTVRTLESSAGADGRVMPGTGWTSIFIYPGYVFRAVDAMVTNFHLPKSTLIMMVSAFAGRDFVLDAYRQAVQEEYRFFSFGDAMLIL